MTLGGLAAAVGLVIDDAIVVLENIVLHRDAGQDRFQAIQSACRELTVPLIGSTITPIVVFLPLISITGVTGSFFRALASHYDGIAADLSAPCADLDSDAEPVSRAAERNSRSMVTRHEASKELGCRSCWSREEEHSRDSLAG